MSKKIKNNLRMYRVVGEDAVGARKASVIATSFDAAATYAKKVLHFDGVWSVSFERVVHAA